MCFITSTRSQRAENAANRPRCSLCTEGWKFGCETRQHGRKSYNTSRICQRAVLKSELEGLFGLRDFIHLLQDIRSRSQLIEQTLYISSDISLHALERNYNVCHSKHFRTWPLNSFKIAAS